MKQTAGKWMLQPMPRWTADGSRTATAGGTGVTVLKTSPMLEEAVDFVVWEHTTPEALMFDFAERQVWPTWRPAFEDPRLSQPIEFFNNQKVGELISEISPEINKWYNSPFWGETTDAAVRLGITPALQEANLTPEAALKAAQQESEELIQFQTA